MHSSICTILILTYKGKSHLEYLLPTVSSAIQQSSQFTLDVVIVDNGCSEEIRSWVEDSFPEFTYIFSSKNDYLFSLNPIIEKLITPFVFILNDDMKLKDDVLDHLIPLIRDDEQIFAVGSNILDWDGVNETIGVRVMLSQKGWAENKYIAFPDKRIRYTLFGGGGAAIFRTSMFNELGGFSTLYRPAYAEDTDICHKAWHKGWPSIVNPSAILYHREGGTILEQFESDDLEIRIRRNMMLWMLRNYSSRGFTLYFILKLPFRLLKWKRQNRNIYLAFLKSIPRLPRALLERWTSGSKDLKDKEIINKLNRVYEA